MVYDQESKLTPTKLKVMNEFLQEAYKIKKEDRAAIIEYLDRVADLEELVMVLSGSYSDREDSITQLRNIDLWIDAFIKERPYLLSFRLHVRKKMNELGVIPWPEYVYKEDNHFKEKL
ncbi:hypothetical protein [Flavobacterium beibuense]|uniref:hypothetical protein n=1 Tax=Flavobacterium beibuense TaxID=657326 RepID=UPI003A952F49